MKNGIKVIFIILVLILMFSNVTAYANDDEGGFGEGIEGLADQVTGPQEADKVIQDRATPILNAYIWFGYAISLGMVVFIGIKYMLGAADARASMKSAMVGWLIGAFVVFMATTIVGWVLNIAIPDKDGTADGLANEIVQNGWDLGS